LQCPALPHRRERAAWGVPRILPEDPRLVK
jgi:hypothetical protein